MVYVIQVHCTHSNGICGTGTLQQWYISYRYTAAMIYVIQVHFTHRNGICHTGTLYTQLQSCDTLGNRYSMPENILTLGNLPELEVSRSWP